jgi:hypothetical protein
MMIAIVLLVSLGIVGASVYAGMLENKRNQNRNSPQAQRNMRRMNLAKAAGAIPNRKENN